jgi:NDP-sugar pyrophosphorylase family protein
MSPDRITKGMILAAGLGTRLRPLTNSTPKPLIEVGGKKIIEFGIEMLARGGVTDIVVNLHHLPDQIKSYLGDGARYGVRIAYSFEPEILGTGGGVKKVEDFFDGPAAVINGDVIMDICLAQVIEFHLKGGFDATLVLRRREDGENYTPVETAGTEIRSFGAGKMMYTGIQIIGPELLKLLPKNAFSDIVTDGYKPLLKKGGQVGAFVHDGFWTDIGTPERLEEAKRRSNASLSPPSNGKF